MTHDELEFKAATRVVAAEKRYRVVKFIIVLICLAAFLFANTFLAYEIRLENNRLASKLEHEVERAIRDIKTQNEETREYSTCLLLVPIDKRTPEVQYKCFKQVDQPGGLEESDFQPTAQGGISAQEDAAPSQGAESDESVSYLQDTPPSKKEPLNSSQPQEKETLYPDAGILQPSFTALDKLVNGVFESVSR